MTGSESSGWRTAASWTIAVLVMLVAVVWQRRTGPSWPRRGTVTVAGEALDYRLPRAATTGAPARVALPDAAGIEAAVLHHRRHPTGEPFTAVPMVAGDDGALAAALPSQPPAGKVEYFVELTTADGVLRVPAGGSDAAVVLRYKGPVPATVLVPHVLLMFLAVLIGVRAGVAALLQPAVMRRHALLALLGMTTGGLVFGPIVQKYAFGAYWTGFPFGYDLTDNKLAVMWLVWAVAGLGVVRGRGRRPGRAARVAVVGATVLMLGVYLIPHSMRGSELDYARLEQVDDPTDAIGTGGR